MRVYALASGAAAEGRRGEASMRLFLFAIVNLPVIANAQKKHKSRDIIKLNDDFLLVPSQLLFLDPIL